MNSIPWLIYTLINFKFVQIFILLKLTSESMEIIHCFLLKLVKKIAKIAHMIEISILSQSRFQLDKIKNLR